MSRLVIILFVFSINIFYTSAQSSIGLQVGVDYSKIVFFESTQESFDNLLEEGFAFPSLLFGISGSHKLSKKLIGEISISHTLKKDIAKTDFQFEPSFYETGLAYNALSTSLSVMLKIVKDTYLGLGLSSRYLYNARAIRVDGVALYSSKNVNNLGLLFCLGYDYDSFTFQLNYGIGRKIPYDIESEFFDLVERIQSLDFRVIYKFTL